MYRPWARHLSSPPHLGLNEWREAFSNPGILHSIVNTFKVALTRQAISFPLAIFLAWLLARTNIPLRGWLEFMFWLSFFMPTLSVTIGWMILLDPQVGMVNQLLTRLPFVERGPFNIYSFWGIVWTHLMANTIAVKVMLLAPAFRRMDAGLEEAGRMSGGTTLGTMLRVTVPIMTPTLVVVFVLAIVRSLESFEIELLLGPPIGFWVYSTKILELVRVEPPLYGQATALGSIILLCLLVLIPFQRWLSTRRQYTTLTGQFKSALIDLGRWKIPAFMLVAIVTILLTVVPFVMTLVGSFMVRFGFFDLPEVWTLEHWKLALGDTVFLETLANTLWMAMGAAFLAPVLFSVIAYFSVRTGLPGRSLLDFISWLPWAIPGMLLGLGLLWVFLGTPIFRPFYGTIFVLVLATVISSMTLGTQIIKGGLLQLGKDLEDASRMVGGSWWATYVRIILPLMMPTLILVGVMNFISAARDVTTIVLLATSETRTLALLTLDFVSEGLRESAAVMAVVIALLTSGVALIARLLGLQIGLKN
jgi:iron(III) transport system permease protein